MFHWTDSQSDEICESRIGGEQFGKCQTQHLTWKPFKTHRKCVKIYIFWMTFKWILSELVPCYDLSKGAELQNESDSNCNCRTHTQHQLHNIWNTTAITTAHTRGYSRMKCSVWTSATVENPAYNLPTAQKISEFKCAVFLLYVLLLFDVSSEIRRLQCHIYDVVLCYCNVQNINIICYSCKMSINASLIPLKVKRYAHAV